MKFLRNIVFIVILFMVIIPFFSYGKEYDIKINCIEILEKSSNTEELNEPDKLDFRVKTNIKFSELNDKIKYKITIKNDSNSDYEIDKNGFVSDSKYISYTLENEDNVIKANEEKELYYVIKYSQEVEKEKLVDSDLEEINNLNINFKENRKIDIIPIIARIVIAIIIFVIILILKKSLGLSLIVVGLFLIIFNFKDALDFQNDKLNNFELRFQSSVKFVGKNAIFKPGKKLNIFIKTLTGQANASTNTKNNLIKSIKYSSENIENIKKLDVSDEGSDYPIYMWYDNGIVYWYSLDKTPRLNKDSYGAFTNLLKLEDISGLENFDASEVEDLSFAFAYNESMTNYESLKKWNTSKVSQLVGTFENNTNLLNLNGLEDWDTSNVTSLHSTFYRCLKLNDVSAIKNWKVEKVEVMQHTFSICISLEEIDLSEWETKSLKNLNSTFGVWNDNKTARFDSKLKRIILSSKFDTSNVTEMIETFSNLTMIEDYSFLKYFDTSNVVNMKQIFQCNYNLTDLSIIKDWNVSNVTNFSCAFEYLINIENLNGLENWDVSNGTLFDKMFLNCSKLIDITALTNWNTKNAESMEYMFGQCNSLTDASAIVNWDVKKVNNFNYMFYTDHISPAKFNQRDGRWNNDGSYIPTKKYDNKSV